MKHFCCFPDCKNQIGSSHVVCVRHWASLPGDVRKDVQYRLRGWKNRDEAIGRVLDYLKNAKKGHYDHVLPD